MLSISFVMFSIRRCRCLLRRRCSRIENNMNFHQVSTNKTKSECMRRVSRLIYYSGRAMLYKQTHETRGLHRISTLKVVLLLHWVSIVFGVSLYTSISLPPFTTPASFCLPFPLVRKNIFRYAQRLLTISLMMRPTPLSTATTFVFVTKTNFPTYFASFLNLRIQKISFPTIQSRSMKF